MSARAGCSIVEGDAADFTYDERPAFPEFSVECGEPVIAAISANPGDDKAVMICNPIPTDDEQLEEFRRVVEAILLEYHRRKREARG